MNWDRIEGNWKTFKGQAKQQWAKLTDDDLNLVAAMNLKAVCRTPMATRRTARGPKSMPG
jgi:hypothetical protein